MQVTEQEWKLLYSWVWAFVIRAVAVIIHTGIPSFWCSTFLGFSMLTALCWRTQWPKAVMVDTWGKQGAYLRECGVEECKGVLPKLPFSANLFICPLCGLQMSLLNSLKIGPFSFTVINLSGQENLLIFKLVRTQNISETVNTWNANDNLPYR